VIGVATAPAASSTGGVPPNVSRAVRSRGAFRWLMPRPAPSTWPRLAALSGAATLSYPPAFATVPGDPGSVSAAIRTRDGAYVAYLNVTPQQGDEKPHGFAAFRVHLLGEDHDEAVHEEAAAEDLHVRGGRGSCVIDNYVTRIGHHHYREIACIVAGAHGTSVMVAAATTASWSRLQTLLQRSVAGFTVS
jgi:hypothetical protein